MQILYTAGLQESKNLYKELNMSYLQTSTLIYTIKKIYGGEE